MRDADTLECDWFCAWLLAFIATHPFRRLYSHNDNDFSYFFSSRAKAIQQEESNYHERCTVPLCRAEAPHLD
jgi:hypothetical protein